MAVQSARVTRAKMVDLSTEAGRKSAVKELNKFGQVGTDGQKDTLAFTSGSERLNLKQQSGNGSVNPDVGVQQFSRGGGGGEGGGPGGSGGGDGGGGSGSGGGSGGGSGDSGSGLGGRGSTGTTASGMSSPEGGGGSVSGKGNPSNSHSSGSNTGGIGGGATERDAHANSFGAGMSTGGLGDPDTGQGYSHDSGKATGPGIAGPDGAGDPDSGRPSVEISRRATGISPEQAQLDQERDNKETNPNESPGASNPTKDPGSIGGLIGSLINRAFNPTVEQSIASAIGTITGVPFGPAVTMGTAMNDENEKVAHAIRAGTVKGTTETDPETGQTVSHMGGAQYGGTATSRGGDVGSDRTNDNIAANQLSGTSDPTQNGDTPTQSADGTGEDSGVRLQDRRLAGGGIANSGAGALDTQDPLDSASDILSKPPRNFVSRRRGISNAYNFG